MAKRTDQHTPGGPVVGPGSTQNEFDEPISQFTVDQYGNAVPESDSTQGMDGNSQWAAEGYSMQNPAPGWTTQPGDLDAELPTPETDDGYPTMEGDVANYGNYSVDFGQDLARDALTQEQADNAMSLSDLPGGANWNAAQDIDAVHAAQPYVPEGEGIDLNTLGPFPGAPRTMGPPSGYDDDPDSLVRDALPPDAEQTAMSLDDAQALGETPDEAATVAADEASGMSSTEAIQDTELGMTSAQAQTEAADEARGMSSTEAIQDTQLGMTSAQAQTEAADEARGMSATEAIQDTQLGMTSDQAATEAADEAQGMSADEAIQDTQLGLTPDQAANEAAAEAQGVPADEAIQNAEAGVTPADPGDASADPIPGLVDPDDPNWSPVPGGEGPASSGEYPGLDLVDQDPIGGGGDDGGDGGPPPDGGGDGGGGDDGGGDGGGGDGGGGDYGGGDGGGEDYGGGDGGGDGGGEDYGGGDDE